MEESGQLASSFHDGGEQLRVLIDGRKLCDGGIGVYISNLLAGLSERSDVSVGVVLSPTVHAKPEIRRTKWYERVEVIEDAAKLYSYDEMMRLPQRLPFNRFDVFHEPHFILPYGVPIPTVVTVHDLIHIQHPERSYYPFVAKPLIRSAISRAASVLTVSDATRLDIEAFLGPDSRFRTKVHVVPNAIDPFFLRRVEPGEYLQQRFGLSGAYLVAVFSSIKPHKGFKDLLQAFTLLKQEALNHSDASYRKFVGDLKLVLAGSGTESIVDADMLLERAGATKDVYLLGSVSKEDLRQLYGSASAAVIASTAEGFCLPAIEAQAQGARLIARPVPAVLELLSERDLVCADFTVEALKGGLAKHCKSQMGSKADRLSPDLARYDRSDITQSIVDVYREITGQFEKRVGAVR